MKGILKKPSKKEVIDEEKRRDSVHTVCMSEATEKQIISDSSSESEGKRNIWQKNNDNPLKIHLKLDDLIRMDGSKEGESSLKSGKINAKQKRIEVLTTTDTSKEDHLRRKPFRGIEGSSSEDEGAARIGEIVNSNMILQKMRGKNKKKSEGSSQYNHISEEGDEAFREAN